MKGLCPIAAFIFLCLACTDNDGPTIIDVVDLIPADNEISGWARNGDMDIAENETQLFALIDGEGVVYVDHGFVKSAFQDFQGDVAGNLRTIHLRVFDVGDSTNARAVYHDSRIENGAETPWTDSLSAGTEARYEQLIGYYSLDFWGNRFYVDIIIDESAQQGLNIIKLFALNISEAM